MAFFNEYILTRTWIPWRIRHQIDRWLYLKAVKNNPTFFRLATLGRFKNIISRVTDGPKFHFFGYYEKTPWSNNEKYLLCHETTFMDRPPSAGDPCVVGYINLDNKKFHPIAETHAWSWQQGAMLQWHPNSDTEKIIFNDRDENEFIAKVINIQSGKTENYPMPFYAVSPKGTEALSLNFARLQNLRPGYGYPGVEDRFKEEYYPENDGVYRIDLSSKEIRRIISINQLYRQNTLPEMKEVFHWVNHLQINPSGTRALLLHRWQSKETVDGFKSRLYSFKLDGSELKCLLDSGTVSHYDWIDDERLVAWAHHPSSGNSFYKINAKNGSLSPIGEGVLSSDGHCSISPDREWILTDTYPDSNQIRNLLIYNLISQKKVDLEKFYSPTPDLLEIRCDLHPRWNRSGDKICVDSIHEGTRQMYIIDIKNLR